jgi:hypothetical protein
LKPERAALSFFVGYGQSGVGAALCRRSPQGGGSAGAKGFKFSTGMEISLALRERTPLPLNQDLNQLHCKQRAMDIEDIRGA